MISALEVSFKPPAGSRARHSRLHHSESASTQSALRKGRGVRVGRALRTGARDGLSRMELLDEAGTAPGHGTTSGGILDRAHLASFDGTEGSSVHKRVRHVQDKLQLSFIQTTTAR